MSYLSGADSDGDGRSVVAADFRNDGRLDLVVRQVGGGPVLLYENQFPAAALPDGLAARAGEQPAGDRVAADADGRSAGAQTRELYPVNSFQSHRCRAASTSGWATRPGSTG